MLPKQFVEQCQQHLAENLHLPVKSKAARDATWTDNLNQALLRAVT